MNYEEFYDVVWNELVSEKVVSDKFIARNEDLVREITYDYFRIYDKSDGMVISLIAKMIESAFYNFQMYGMECDEDKSSAYDSFYD